MSFSTTCYLRNCEMPAEVEMRPEHAIAGNCLTGELSGCFLFLSILLMASRRRVSSGKAGVRFETTASVRLAISSKQQ